MMKERFLARLLLLAITLITACLLFGCGAKWHIKRAMKKDPSMFKDTTVVIKEVKDTIVYKTEKDTVLFDSTLNEYVRLVNMYKSMKTDTTIIHDREVRNNYIYRIDKDKTKELERLIAETRKNLLDGFHKDTSIVLSDSLYNFELHIRNGVISTNFEVKEKSITIKKVEKPEGIINSFIRDNKGGLFLFLILLLLIFLVRMRNKSKA